MMWTSLSKVAASGSVFTWLGGVENSLEETANITGGDCAALKGNFLQGATCDSSLAYVCEKNPPMYTYLNIKIKYSHLKNFICVYSLQVLCLVQQGKFRKHLIKKNVIK